MFIAPPDFSFLVSIDILVMTLLGGSGSLTGAIFGAVTYRLLLELLRPVGLWRFLVTPILLFFLILFKPTGLYGQREPWILRDHWVDEPIVSRRRGPREREQSGTLSP
jgi:branched-chain amino acid transport system permease protein